MVTCLSLLSLQDNPAIITQFMATSWPSATQACTWLLVRISPGLWSVPASLGWIHGKDCSKKPLSRGECSPGATTFFDRWAFNPSTATYWAPTKCWGLCSLASASRALSTYVACGFRGRGRIWARDLEPVLKRGRSLYGWERNARSSEDKEILTWK